MCLSQAFVDGLPACLHHPVDEMKELLHLEGTESSAHQGFFVSKERLLRTTNYTTAK